MTLIIGIECADCLLLCGDTEESTEFGGKRSVSKIHFTRGSDWSMAIAMSGSMAVSENAASRIITEARQCKTFPDNPRTVLDAVLLETYEKYVFPRDAKRQRERDISLIIGIVPDNGPHPLLYKTIEEVVVEQRLHVCAGAGQEIANYFLDRIYDEHLTGEQASSLSAFLIREAKSSVGGVGRDSEFWSLFYPTPAGPPPFFHRRVISGGFDWREIPNLKDCLHPFWKSNKLSNPK